MPRLATDLPGWHGVTNPGVDTGWTWQATTWDGTQYTTTWQAIPTDSLLYAWDSRAISVPEPGVNVLVLAGLVLLLVLRRLASSS